MSRFRSNIELFQRLKEIFGTERIKRREAELFTYGQSPGILSLLALKRGEMRTQPDFIVWPETVEEISRLVRLANDWKIPVIPFGGGSNLRGSTTPVKGGIVCDMKKLNRILALDEYSHVVSVQAGILVETLERELARKGYTLGHAPLSAHSSTIGGAAATRAAGLLSTKYGTMADMVIGLQAVLPDGSIVKTRAAPRSATGPDFDHLLMGSEGTLAIITRAKLRVHTAPLSREFAAFRFSSFKDGANAARLLLRQGLQPAALRLSDADETKLTFAQTEFSGSGSLLALAFDGNDGRTALEAEMAGEIAKLCHGHAMGREPAEYWWQHRFAENFRRQAFLSQDGAVMDRIDVAATWSRIVPLYKGLRKAVEAHADATVSLSGADANGAALTCLWTAKTKPGAEEQIYHAVWDAAMKALRETGGTISHSLGIGLDRAAWLPEELGNAFGLLKKMKARLDPNNIMNPGKLGMV